MPLRPDGRLAVVIERVTNPPPTESVAVVVRVTGAATQSVEEASLSRGDSVRIIRSTLQFDLPKAVVRDKGTQIVLEVYREAGELHGAMSMHVWKVVRGDDVHGSFPLWSCTDPSKPAYSDASAGSDARVTTVDLSISYAPVVRHAAVGGQLA
eukprot:CAMPEP_0169466648 /NCGR_PEP_ID=MMETSP1042-20121227/21886_1 /TAXON_ID=464988 /ORGANISM="Hemiselmis andersenii, Strain CCMP1180" /LENGTH=152 /DNA_ID=CAMNT_0009579727 /DNA_START=89 /DNA_END=543 /DNA_ORIENTATION=+